MAIHSERTAGYEKNCSFRFRYETLRSLLKKNGSALQNLSDLEADLNHMRHYDKRIKSQIQRLMTGCLLMAQELNLMTGDHYLDLYGVVFRLRNKIDRLFSKGHPQADDPLVVRFDEQTGPDPALVGGKASGVWQLGQYFKEWCTPGICCHHRCI